MSPPKCKIKFSVSGPGHALNLSVILDGRVHWQGCPSTEPQQIELEFDDVESQHILSLQMSGKTKKHTVLDAQGNIISDLLINFQDFSLDDINIDQLVTKLAYYNHDFNSTGQQTRDEFFHCMGCNGTVTLQFSTPAYLWLLENL